MTEHAMPDTASNTADLFEIIREFRKHCAFRPATPGLGFSIAGAVPSDGRAAGPVSADGARDTVDRPVHQHRASGTVEASTLPSKKRYEHVICRGGSGVGPVIQA